MKNNNHDYHNELQYQDEKNKGYWPQYEAKLRSEFIPYEDDWSHDPEHIELDQKRIDHTTKCGITFYYGKVTK